MANALQARQLRRGYRLKGESAKSVKAGWPRVFGVLALSERVLGLLPVALCERVSFTVLLFVSVWTGSFALCEGASWCTCSQ